MRGSRVGKGIALVLVAAVGTLSAGCFGKFQLTRKVYDMNKSIDDKYVRSAATWIFVIVPVYGIAAILDLIVFNVIEFWTGENPVAGAKVTKVFAHAGGKTVLTLSRDGSATVAVIDRYEGERLASTLRIRDDGSGKVTAVETAAGKEVREISASASADGSVNVTTTTASGTDTERFAAQAVGTKAAYAARIASEVRRDLPGAGGTNPLAAVTPRYELRAAGVPPQQEKRGARVPAYGG